MTKDIGFRLRPSIKSLSDLIFGLALSIGALTLIDQAIQSIHELFASLVYFAFSFFILISVWRVYSTIVSVLPNETSRMVNLNILLLFLVTIEPFLLNQVFSQSGELLNNVSIMYALDLGAMFLILAYFDHALSQEEKNLVPKEYQDIFRKNRYFDLLTAGIFLISIIPVFGTVEVFNITSDSTTYSLTLRALLWIIVFPLRPLKNLVLNRGKKLKLLI
jgi:uncharacterized membrane protein